MKSKGTQTMQKIVIKKPWGVEIKDYKAGDPIPAGVKFKIFDAKDTAKIEAYADSLDESADYQKKRFKEPAYMYESTKKLNEAYYIKRISSNRNNYFGEVGGYPMWGDKHEAFTFDDEEKAEKYKRKYEYLFDRENEVKVVKESKTLKEGYLITAPSIEGKTAYVKNKEGKGTTFNKDEAFVFDSENNAKDTLDQMKKAGYYVDKAKIVKESLSSKTHKFKPEELKVGKRVIDKVGGHEVHGKITVNHHDLYKDNPYTQDKKGSTVVTIITDKGRSYDVDANDNGGEFILESRIAKGYENLNADERAKHLLSHPSSKYMSDLKSENITERAIRKAVKEMLGKPAKDDPQFIIDVNEGCDKVEESFLIVGKLPYDDLKQAYISYSDKGIDIHTPEYKKYATRFSSRQEAQKVLDQLKKEGWHTEKFDIVQEEGEAPAIANTTAEVANPELPLKLKEDKIDDLMKTAYRIYKKNAGRKSYDDWYDEILNPYSGTYGSEEEYLKAQGLLEGEDELENTIKYQTSVAGGMGTDAENAESAQEHDDKVVMVKEHKSFRKFLKESH